MKAYVIASLELALLVAVPLLLLIRWSVRRYMRKCGQGQNQQTPLKAEGHRGGAAPLRIETIDTAPGTRASGPGRGLFRRTGRMRVAAAAIYLIGGIACMFVLARGGCADLSPDAHSLCYLLMLAISAWPVVLTVIAVAAASTRRKRLGWVLGFAIFYGIVSAVFGEWMLWLIAAGLPTIVLIGFTNSWLKTIAPLIAVVPVLLAAALKAGVAIFHLYDPITAMVAFIVAIPSAMGALVLFIRAYRRKKFGDLWFDVAFLWAVFAFCYVLLRGERAWNWSLAGLGVWAVVTLALLPWLRRVTRRHPPVPLLVLRVFGASRRVQRLFEDLGARWRYIGPIHLIAGVDSVVANLDLDEAARYLTFRFRSLYVKNFDDLHQRIAALDQHPDPDGRYRINDFFCFDDMWKPTFVELLHRSQAVLVDLGGFGPQNVGVAFELGQLLARRPLDTFVLVTDQKTDTTLLHDTLTFLWTDLDPSSPNAQLTDPVLRILHRPSPAGLVAALCDAAVAAAGIIPECSGTRHLPRPLKVTTATNGVSASPPPQMARSSRDTA